jgi:GDP-L-fucose synthase|tara:strand:- start:1211 stop:2104 length:894 start_codon:yes stop_codon:yes gene_type:complete
MKYYIAGNRGLVGKHYLELYPDACGGNTSVTDYTRYSETHTHVLSESQPTHVILNAATVGGLQEDLDRSFELMMRNLDIQNNIFRVASESGVQRLLLQGSTCSYPEHGDQPFTEEQLFDGKPYDGYMTTALPKLVGMYQCRAINDKRGTKWRTAICTNMFGPGDRIGKHAHVIGALMQKFVDAVKNDHTEIEIWGSGDQSRDILYIKDAIRAMDIILNNDMFDTVNIASGMETSIREIAETLKQISGFTGRLWYNTDRPEGIKNRAISNSRLRSLGWEPEYTVVDALRETYEWYYNQ